MDHEDVALREEIVAIVRGVTEEGTWEKGKKVMRPVDSLRRSVGNVEDLAVDGVHLLVRRACDINFGVERAIDETDW